MRNALGWLANMTRLILLLLFAAFLANPVLAARPPQPLICGVALGYPPYQFTGPNGEVTGIDADIARLVFQEIGIQFKFRQESWDSLYLGLAHDVGKVDVLCGTEMNPLRTQLFDFSIPYYKRTVVIFVKAASPYRKLADLSGRIITGERGGLIETLLDKYSLRIMATTSKADSFFKLQTGVVDAVLAPLEVGNWLSKQIHLPVRSLPEKDPGSPVAFAVAKGNRILADKISVALAKLQKNGKLAKVFQKYQ